jgi:predicted ATPase
VLPDYQPHATCVLVHRVAALDHPYAAELPAIKSLAKLDLHPHVTFFVGENGSGKRTLLEAIAVADGFKFNAEGIRPIAYLDTEHYRVTHACLSRPEQTMRLLFEDDDAGEAEPRASN